jgi:hypothetical protein
MSDPYATSKWLADTRKRKLTSVSGSDLSLHLPNDGSKTFLSGKVLSKPGSGRDLFVYALYHLRQPSGCDFVTKSARDKVIGSAWLVSELRN